MPVQMTPQEHYRCHTTDCLLGFSLNVNNEPFLVEIPYPTNSQGKSLQAIANLGTEWNHEPHVVRPKCKCHLPPAMHEAPPYLLKLIPASIVTTMRDEIDEFASNNLGMTEPVSSKVASVRFACGRPVGHPERCDYQLNVNKVLKRGGKDILHQVWPDYEPMDKPSSRHLALVLKRNKANYTKMYGSAVSTSLSNSANTAPSSSSQPTRLVGRLQQPLRQTKSFQYSQGVDKHIRPQTSMPSSMREFQEPPVQHATGQSYQPFNYKAYGHSSPDASNFIPPSNSSYVPLDLPPSSPPMESHAIPSSEESIDPAFTQTVDCKDCGASVQFLELGLHGPGVCPHPRPPPGSRRRRITDPFAPSVLRTDKALVHPVPIQVTRTPLPPMDRLAPPLPSPFTPRRLSLEQLLPGVQQADLEQIHHVGFSTECRFFCPRCREWNDVGSISSHVQGLCEHACADKDGEHSGKRRRVEPETVYNLHTPLGTQTSIYHHFTGSHTAALLPLFASQAFSWLISCQIRMPLWTTYSYSFTLHSTREITKGFALLRKYHPIWSYWITCPPILFQPLPLHQDVTRPYRTPSTLHSTTIRPAECLPASQQPPM